MGNTLARNITNESIKTRKIDGFFELEDYLDSSDNNYLPVYIDVYLWWSTLLSKSQTLSVKEFLYKF